MSFVTLTFTFAIKLMLLLTTLMWSRRESNNKFNQRDFTKKNCFRRLCFMFEIDLNDTLSQSGLVYNHKSIKNLLAISYKQCQKLYDAIATRHKSNAKIPNYQHHHLQASKHWYKIQPFDTLKGYILGCRLLWFCRLIRFSWLYHCSNYVFK